MSELLRTEKLTRDFGALWAVNEVDFSVKRGEVRSLIGSNGAGKSTFLDLVINKTAPTGGKVIFNGEDITGMAPHLIVRRGIGRCFQISKFFPNLSVYENIQIPCIHKNSMTFSMFRSAEGKCAEQVEQLMEAVGIQDSRDKFAGNMSYGDQRRLEIAITLAAQPEMLLLDEPTSGVARKEGYMLMELVVNLAKERDLTVVFIEHDMDIVFNYSDTISVLHYGKLIANGRPQEIRDNEEVQAAYLGGLV